MASFTKSKDKLEELNLTQDELERFTEALQKPEFKELFLEYANEISDPVNRAKYENEIQQMENERGMDIKFVNPEPGFVIKTTVDGGKKAFINICKNELIDKPSSHRQTGHDGRPGFSWSLPHSFTPPREDLTKAGVKCTIFDFVVHPDTYRMCETNSRFKKMLIDTALDGIKKMFDVDLDIKNLKFPKMKYKGTPTATVIRSKKVEGTTAKQDPDNIVNQFPYPYDEKTSKEKAEEIIAHNEKVQASRTQNKNMEKKELKDDLFAMPKYTIKYQSSLDIQDFTNAPEVRNNTRPTKLIIEIKLPLLQSASSISLDVFERRLLLVSKEKAKYKLDINLTYPVNEDEGSAKFDKTARTLIVTLPVLPDKSIPKLPFNGGPCEIAQEHSDSGLNDGEENQTMLTDEKENNKPLIEVISESISHDVGEVNDNKKQKKPNDGVLETNVDPSLVKSVQNTDWLLPEFHCRENVQSLSFIFSTKKIKRDSIVSSFLNHNIILVQMTSVGDGGFPVHYRCCLKFTEDSYIDTDNCRFWFDEIGCVHLLVTKSSMCIGYWKNYSVGIDTSYLEERCTEIETDCSGNGAAIDTSSDTLMSLSSREVPQLTFSKQNTISNCNELNINEEECNTTSTEIIFANDIDKPVLPGILKMKQEPQCMVSESSDLSETSGTVNQKTDIASSIFGDSEDAPDSPNSGSVALETLVSFDDQITQTYLSIDNQDVVLQSKQENIRTQQSEQVKLHCLSSTRGSLSQYSEDKQIETLSSKEPYSNDESGIYLEEQNSSNDINMGRVWNSRLGHDKEMKTNCQAKKNCDSVTKTIKNEENGSEVNTVENSSEGQLEECYNTVLAGREETQFENHFHSQHEHDNKPCENHDERNNKGKKENSESHEDEKNADQFEKLEKNNSEIFGGPLHENKVDCTENYSTEVIGDSNIDKHFMDHLQRKTDKSKPPEGNDSSMEKNCSVKTLIPTAITVLSDVKTEPDQNAKCTIELKNRSVFELDFE